MTKKEYESLKENESIILITKYFDKGRKTKRFIKYTNNKGLKGVLIGICFYTLKDIEIVKAGE